MIKKIVSINTFSPFFDESRWTEKELQGINDSIKRYLEELSAIYTKPLNERNESETEKLSNIFFDGVIVIEDAEQDNRFYYCEIWNHEYVKQRIKQNLPFFLDLGIRDAFEVDITEDYKDYFKVEEDPESPSALYSQRFKEIENREYNKRLFIKP